MKLQATTLDTMQPRINGKLGKEQPDQFDHEIKSSWWNLKKLCCVPHEKLIVMFEMSFEIIRYNRSEKFP